MESAPEFLTLGAESAEQHWKDEYWEDLENIGMSLRRLSGRRKNELRAFESPVRPPEAWSVKIYQEAILYRLVATAQGAIINWNAGNVLCSFLAARAFYETFAVLWKFDRTLEKAVGEGDLIAIRNVTKKFLHATRDKQLLSHYPELKATNIQTFIDNLSAEFPAARDAYDLMSEKCHPNSLGTFQMFADIDVEARTVTYSDRKNANEAFFLIFNIISLIRAVELLIEGLDERIEDVAALEHKRYSSG